jgi:hypothetical protein
MRKGYIILGITYFTSSNLIIFEYQLVVNTWYKYDVYILLKTILNVIA